MVVDVDKIRAEKLRRSAKKPGISFEEFSKVTDEHREAVNNALYSLADRLEQAGEIHDWTKKQRGRQFYDSFTSAKEKGLDFKKDDWYRYHVTTERHHIASHVANDINLIDVLEMISDCCCAGLARSGKIYDLDIDPEVLIKAFNNTLKLVASDM